MNMQKLKKLPKSVFFQDCVPNYGIYSGLFLMFEELSLLVFKICIILQETAKIRIHSTSIFLLFLKANIRYMDFFYAKFSDQSVFNFRNRLYQFFRKMGKLFSLGKNQIMKSFRTKQKP